MRRNTAERPNFPRLLRLRDVERFAGIRRTQIYQHVQDGTFPRPIKITDGGRAIAWPEEELVAWREERLAARDRNDGGGHERS
jgi:prophage regulatory protein